MSHITAELTSLRLSLSVAHDLPNFVTFEVRIDASVPGCAVLPLWLGPIAVTQRLPQPVGPAPWSRAIPLRGLGDEPLRIHEAQDSTAVIASSTWDPGVLLAAYLAESIAGRSASVLGGTLERSGGAQPLRCVEIGCGCGVAGLALAAALPDSLVLLTDGDTRACELAQHNAAANGLASRVHARELRWMLGGGDVRGVLSALGGAPDVVLAADVVYREETFPALVETLAALCDAGRSTGRPPKIPRDRSSSGHGGSGGGGSVDHADGGGGGGGAGACDVLFAYRPRIEDEHFFHLLLDHFTMTTVVAPRSAGALLYTALSADEFAPHDTSGAGSDDARDRRCDGGREESGAIYRLRRRDVPRPTTCPTCKQLRARASRGAHGEHDGVQP